MSKRVRASEKVQRGGFVRLPAHAPQARIGLFGGTFNPPHEGHRLAALLALKRLDLDQVWWLVTPGNPLKENSALPTLSQRLAATRLLAAHPRMKVTSFEADIGARYSIDTIRWLKRRCPGARFVWLMGADSLVHFHRWQSWREIATRIPIAIVDRPASTLRATNARAGHFLARYRAREADARKLPLRQAPAFIFLHGPRSEISSTRLREQRV